MNFNMKKIMEIVEIREILIDKVYEVGIVNIILDMVLEMEHEEEKKDIIIDYLVDKKIKKQREEEIRVRERRNNNRRNYVVNLHNQLNNMVAQEYAAGHRLERYNVNFEAFNNELARMITDDLLDVELQLLVRLDA